MTKHPSTACRDCGLQHGNVRHPDGTPPPPFGCRWCGIHPAEHRARRTAAAGLHTWERPTDAQILARMRARRVARVEARHVAAALVEFERAAGLVGPAERRRRERAEHRRLIEGPVAAWWPPAPTRCDAMNHNSRGDERFCEIEDPHHEGDHDAGDGFTWERED
ncbi:hypothetical protein [Streptomyces sp. KAU_LT]|uniref:hypothetical protein n=1 Tax=Streptomyces sp. KAU_LT TaxID=3046669 RepID=UPI0024B70095|nr:hypothetical protein [Streptomyces sp. KAU_LT]MDI9836225.1 hypothetical protein [Streptomyces sp. KAU_LT]